jgi:hypothetical protein
LTARSNGREMRTAKYGPSGIVKSNPRAKNMKYCVIKPTKNEI